MKQPDEITVDELQDEVPDFGEAEPGEKKPLWKRELLFGYSLPWLLGAALMVLGGIVYLYGPSLSFISPTPSDSAFSEVENTLNGTSPAPSGTQQGISSPPPLTAQVAPPAQPAMHSDTITMMSDIRDELNARDSKMNDSLLSLKDSVTRLSDAIKRDEAYALESRNLLNQLNQRLTALEAKQAPTAVTKSGTVTKRQSMNPISGMQVMSLENGMAWIKWQGSTWAVREGDTLGKVTIRRIDPASRTVVTTGGSLR